jgi:hypothetical protein
MAIFDSIMLSQGLKFGTHQIWIQQVQIVLEQLKKITKQKVDLKISIFSLDYNLEITEIGPLATDRDRDQEGHETAGVISTNRQGNWVQNDK